MALGLLLIGGGIGLAFMWPHEFVIALKGALIFGLLLFGLIVTLIALSRRKAHREYQVALRDETGDPPPQTQGG